MSSVEILGFSSSARSVCLYREAALLGYTVLVWGRSAGVDQGLKNNNH